MKLKHKMKLLFGLIVVNTLVYAAEIEYVGEEEEAWWVQTDNTEKFQALRKDWQDSLVQIIWEGDKDGGTKDNPIVLNQIGGEQFRQINNLLQKKEIDEKVFKKGIFHLIKALVYVGKEDIIKTIVFTEPKCESQKMPPGGQMICIMLLQKNNKDKGFCEKLLNLVVNNGDSKEVISKLLKEKPSLKETAVQLRSSKVEGKIKAFECYKNFSFTEQRMLKKIQQFQTRECSKDILLN